MAEEWVKVSVRLPESIVVWLDQQAAINRRGRSEEVRVALLQRRLQQLPKWQREELVRKLRS